MTIILCSLLLLVGALSDLKSKTISIIIPMAGSISGVLLLFLSGNKESLVIGAVFGMIIFLISVVVKDFGIGDGLMIFVLGILRGINICMESILIAFVISTAWGIVLLLIKRKKEKMLIPFLPFLLVSYMAVEIARVGSAA